MQVIAKYQIAYRNRLYKAGEVFELEQRDFERYRNDVLIYAQKPKPLSTKPLKSTVSIKAIRPKQSKFKR